MQNIHASYTHSAIEGENSSIQRFTYTKIYLNLQIVSQHLLLSAYSSFAASKTFFDYLLTEAKKQLTFQTAIYEVILYSYHFLNIIKL